ncbi:hypothetical protein PM082_007807 [Marasmius tenuissimus]|nr:hypothetical protein PM082_007807 [Marasmius tenuissimus]
MSRPTPNYHSTNNDDLSQSHPPQHPHSANPNQTPLASASPPYGSNEYGRGGMNVGEAQHDLHNTGNRREAAVVPGVNDPYRQQSQNQAPVIPGVNDPYRDNPGESDRHHQDPNVHVGVGVGPPRTHHDTHHGGGLGNSTVVGKLQRMAGEALGNPGMQEKGAMKEREAQKHTELAEAERLEREAALHRERAAQIERGEQPAYTV